MKRKGSAARKSPHTFHVIIEQDESGYFVAECLALKACYSQGKTFEEAMRNIRDVIEMCLADLRAGGKAIPREPEVIGLTRVQVRA